LISCKDTDCHPRNFAKTDSDERFELLIMIFINGLAAQARLS
jgi:hypothetical protein